MERTREVITQLFVLLALMVSAAAVVSLMRFFEVTGRARLIKRLEYEIAELARKRTDLELQQITLKRRDSNREVYSKYETPKEVSQVDESLEDEKKRIDSEIEGNSKALDDRNQRLDSLQNLWRKNFLESLVAATLVPVLLATVDSGVLANSVTRADRMLIFFGYCVLAALIPHFVIRKATDSFQKQLGEQGSKP